MQLIEVRNQTVFVDHLRGTANHDGAPGRRGIIFLQKVVARPREEAVVLEGERVAAFRDIHHLKGTPIGAAAVRFSSIRRTAIALRIRGLYVGP